MSLCGEIFALPILYHTYEHSAISFRYRRLAVFVDHIFRATLISIFQNLVLIEVYIDLFLSAKDN